MKKIITIISMCMAFIGCTQIDQTERAVVKVWGEVDGVKAPGFVWYNPISTSLHRMTVTVQQVRGSMEASSKDMQKVNTAVLVNYHFDPMHVDSIYSRFGDEFEKQFFGARILEAMRTVISQYKADTILALSERMQREMKDVIVDKLDSANVPAIIDGLVIEHIGFSDEYSKAIEAKQVAEQDAQRAEKVLVRVEKENEQKKVAARADSAAKVTAAKADSVAIETRLRALHKANTKEYIMLEWIKTWNGELPKVAGNDKFMPIVDMR